MEVLRAGAQPVRSVRTAFDRNLRRAYRWKARRVARTAAAAAALFGAAVVLALILDTWLPVVVVLLAFAAEAAQLAWKARPQRGRARGWAPGSLRPGHDTDVDPDHLTRRARRDGPVFKTWLLNSPTVCIVDLDFARDLFRRHADDLGHAWITVERFVPGGTIREVDGAWYAELRRLRTRALTSTLVRSWEPVLARSVVSQLTALAGDVGASGSGISPLPYVREMVLAAWSDTLLGFAPDDPAYSEVSSLVFDLDPDRHIYGHGIPDDEVVIKLDRLAALVESARWNPDGSRGCPSLAARIEEIQPGALADPSIMRDYLFEMINTRDDMSGLLMWVLKYLAEHPTWTQRLRDAEDDQQQLAEQIVSETLRLAQSEYLFRRARTEIEFRGVVIPARWLVRVCLREIHRDPAQFEHAGEFDPDRFADGGCGREVYAPFGIDHHACVGETLTRTFARIFATELVRSFDCVTTRDGPVEMSVERHWAPSSRWRVAVRARDAAPAHR